MGRSVKSDITLSFLVFALAGVVASVPGGAADPNQRVMWRDPGPIATKDLYWGVGSADRAPRPPFSFVKEDASGTSPKIQVTDATGTAWSVKFATERGAGNEVHAEVASSRLTAAFGYFVDENYFVAEGQIAGVTGLGRAAASVAADGSFRAARFERVPADAEQIGRWDIADGPDNPFVGTRELSGLKILIMVLNNWDARSGNTAILRVKLPGGQTEDRYLVSDLGTAFGRMDEGMFRKHSRWNLEHYKESRLVQGITGQKLEFRHGVNSPERMSVPLEHARWFMGMTSQLSHAQVRRAFEAAGASPAEIDGFSTRVMERFDELHAAVRERN